MKSDNINLGHLQIIDGNNENIARITEQLNGLLDRYTALYEIHLKYVDQIRLEKVLYQLEQAIEAICLKITTIQGILTFKE